MYEMLTRSTFVLVFDACVWEGLAPRVVVVVRLFAALLLSNVYKMLTRSTFVLVFDACVCEGLAPVIIGVGDNRLSSGACFCCSMLVFVAQCWLSEKRGNVFVVASIGIYGSNPYRVYILF